MNRPDPMYVNRLTLRSFGRRNWNEYRARPAVTFSYWPIRAEKVLPKAPRKVRISSCISRTR